MKWVLQNKVSHMHFCSSVHVKVIFTRNRTLQSVQQPYVWKIMHIPWFSTTLLLKKMQSIEPSFKEQGSQITMTNIIRKSFEIFYELPTCDTETQHLSEQMLWKNSIDGLVWHGAATNVPFVEHALPGKQNKPGTPVSLGVLIDTSTRIGTRVRTWLWESVEVPTPSALLNWPIRANWDIHRPWVNGQNRTGTLPVGCSWPQAWELQTPGRSLCLSLRPRKSLLWNCPHQPLRPSSQESAPLGPLGRGEEGPWQWVLCTCYFCSLNALQGPSSSLTGSGHCACAHAGPTSQKACPMHFHLLKS